MASAVSPNLPNTSTAEVAQANPTRMPFYCPHHPLPSYLRTFMTGEDTREGESPAGVVGPGAISVLAVSEILF